MAEAGRRELSPEGAPELVKFVAEEWMHGNRAMEMLRAIDRRLECVEESVLGLHAAATRRRRRASQPLSRLEADILALLKKGMDANGFVTRVSSRFLAKKLRVTPKVIRDRTKGLEVLGYLVIGKPEWKTIPTYRILDR
jgi:hypothetical protein